MNKLLVSPSPHIQSPDTTASIMLDVIISLVPATVYGFILFGWRAAVVVAVTIAAALLSEFLWNKALKKENSLGDLSAAVTGLILALNLPSTIPLWMAALGSAIAIIIVKLMFGGLGHNFANPAMTARIVLMVSFPVAMTTFSQPLSSAITSATPMVNPLGYSNIELLFGMHGGAIGEGNVILLAIGGIYLMSRRVISPIIPISFIGTTLLLTWALYPIYQINPVSSILSGGLFLGAIFMATDYVTSPTFNLGKLIFGVGCGLITVVIRVFGSLPEGVSYAILLMNLLVPYINMLTARKPFFKEEVTNE